MKCTILVTLLASVGAFVPAFRSQRKTLSMSTIDDASMSTIDDASMSTIDDASMLTIDDAFGVSLETGGKCTPLGAKILEGSQPAALKWFQNAEIKHGRIAMVAVLGFMNQKFGVHFPLYFGPTGSNVFSPTSDQAWFLSKSAGITFSDVAAA